MEVKMANPENKITTIDQVIAKTIEENGCWTWQAGCHPQGLPMVRFDGQMMLVTRLMKSDQLGVTLRKDQRVKNTCGNKKCINPDHLHVYEPGEKGWESLNIKYNIATREKIAAEWTATPHYNGKAKEFATRYKMTDATFRKILREQGAYTPMRKGRPGGRPKKNK